MAKMWKVPRVSCDRTFTWNARQILATRVAEVYARVPALGNPRDATGHHDLRISIKRLRYSLEFFAVCYDEQEASEILSALSTMQDHLGDLHDADEFIPELQEAFDKLDEDRGRELRDVAARSENGDEPRSFEEFTSALGYRGEASPRDGILAVINQLRAQRREKYAAAVDLWTKLEAEGFRTRLERLGDEAEGGT